MIEKYISKHKNISRCYFLTLSNKYVLTKKCDCYHIKLVIKFISKQGKVEMVVMVSIEVPDVAVRNIYI